MLAHSPPPPPPPPDSWRPLLRGIRKHFRVWESHVFNLVRNDNIFLPAELRIIILQIWRFVIRQVNNKENSNWNSNWDSNWNSNWNSNRNSKRNWGYFYHFTGDFQINNFFTSVSLFWACSCIEVFLVYRFIWMRPTWPFVELARTRICVVYYDLQLQW